MEYWFRPRRYGYGATPVTWQGWAAVIALPVFLVVVALALFVWSAPGPWSVVVFLLVDLGAVLAFIAFARRRTDGEWRWRWGR